MADGTGASPEAETGGKDEAPVRLSAMESEDRIKRLRRWFRESEMRPTRCATRAS